MSTLKFQIQRIKNIFHLIEAVIANIYFGMPSRKIKVIGVTGTDGKTTTTHLIYHILVSSGKKASFISSIHAKIGDRELETGLHTTTPRAWTIQKFLSQAHNAGSEYFVLEATSHSIDQNRVWGVNFAFSVLTNITTDHLYHHGTQENYFKLKTRLLLQSKQALINKDDVSYEKVKNVLEAAGANYKTYSIYEKNNVDYFWTTNIKTQIKGDYNKQNILAAYALSRQLNLSEAQILAAIASYQLPQGRLDIVYDKDFKIIIDFAHTPNSIYSVLKSVHDHYLLGQGRIIHVFGAASQRDDQKRPLMGTSSGQFANFVILTEEDRRHENINDINQSIIVGLEGQGLKKGAAEKGYICIDDRYDAIKAAINMARRDDIVVITGKGHEKSLNRAGREYSWNEYEAVKKAMAKKIYMVGIKGVGMAALALVYKKMGFFVEGVDTDEVFGTDEILKNENIVVKEGFAEENIPPDADLVITTGAHAGLYNEEVREARARKIKVMTQAEALGELMDKFKIKIAICGTHGKTTTSALTSFVLQKIGSRLGWSVGAPKFSGLPGGGYRGDDYFVAEADEYFADIKALKKARFLFQNPDFILATNVDFDHPDAFSNLAEVKAAFSSFFKKLDQKPTGKLIYCIDNKNVAMLAAKLPAEKKSSYGFSNEADLIIYDLREEEAETKFKCRYKNDLLGEFTIKLPGLHNALNAGGVILLMLILQIDIEKVRQSISQFSGASRRFEKIFEFRDTLLFDDYAHHPEEIKATLTAASARFPGRKIIAIFQPHMYSRTKALLSEFAVSLSGADQAYVIDIFSSAREKQIDFKITSADIEKAAVRQGLKNVKYILVKDLLLLLSNSIKRGDLIITLGAGDINKHHNDIIKLIKGAKTYV